MNIVAAGIKRITVHTYRAIIIHAKKIQMRGGMHTRRKPTDHRPHMALITNLLELSRRSRAAVNRVDL